MSAEPILAPALPTPKPTLPRLSVRIEYLDCQTLPGYREYRLAVCGPDEFVLIVRDPYVVYASTMHFWNTTYREYALQAPPYRDVQSMVLETV